LTRYLLERGARVLHWGSIGFAPPEDPALFLRSMEQLERYDWICFSSPRAVDAVVSRVPGPPLGVRMAVVGPSTARVLLEAGWPVDRVPEEASGSGLVDAFRVAGDAAGARVFFPASAIARDVVPEGLTALGAEVHQVTAYRMLILPLDVEACSAAVQRGEVQVVTFASPSATEGLRAGLGEDLFLRVAAEIPAAAMGPTTAESLRNAGWARIAVAAVATLEGLAEVALEVGRG
jgi:uroporphyrinogen-III synthase